MSYGGNSAMPEVQPNGPPAAWYPDPDGSGQQRYFDGAAWTDVKVASPPDTGTATASDEEPRPPRRRRGALRKVVVLVAILVVLVVVLWSVMVNFVAQSYSIPSEGM